MNPRILLLFSLFLFSKKTRTQALIPFHKYSNSYNPHSHFFFNTNPSIRFTTAKTNIFVQSPQSTNPEGEERSSWPPQAMEFNDDDNSSDYSNYNPFEEDPDFYVENEIKSNAKSGKNGKQNLENQKVDLYEDYPSFDSYQTPSDFMENDDTNKNIPSSSSSFNDKNSQSNINPMEKQIETTSYESKNNEKDKHPNSSSTLEKHVSVPSNSINKAPSETRDNVETNSPTVKSFVPSSIFANLNPSQYEAVTSLQQSVTRVIAGPGAGKTRVLTSRIAYLLYQPSSSDEYDPNDQYGDGRIMAVTFTKKAAGEMQHRLESLCINAEKELQQQRSMNMENHYDHEIRQEEVESEDSDKPPKPAILDKVTVGTFHSICARILRRNGDLLSTLLPSTIETGTTPSQKDGKVETSLLNGNFGIIDQSEQIRLIKDSLKEKGVTLDKLPPSITGGSSRTIKPIQILNEIQKRKEHDLSIPSKSPPQTPTKGAPYLAHLIYPLYTTELYSSNSVDFQDLILLTRLLLFQNMEVRKRIQGIYKHILVDEFQDTSQVQLELVQMLTTKSLMVVGDSDQSIYSWRGANGAESMQNIETIYKSDASTIYLMENYRSTTNIVKAAQKIINHGTSSKDEKNQRQNMKPMRGVGPTPRILACRDAEKEAAWVVQQILTMSNPNDSTQEYPLPSDATVAIIFRTNAQSRLLEEACVKYNLRYAVRGAAGTFYTRAEIKDCLCFLKWMYNGRDSNAMIRCCKTPSRGIGPKAIQEFEEYCFLVQEYSVRHGDSPPSYLDVLLSFSNESKLPIPTENIISKRAMNRFGPLATQMNKICQMAQTLTVSELLSYIITTLNLKAHFDSISKTSSEFADRWSNVMELCQASERYGQDGPCNPPPSNHDSQSEANLTPLSNFLEDVALLTDTQPEDAPTGRIVANLMTIHAAKGMEFDAVFLVGNEEGTFPTQRAISEGEGSVELEEERRLCYVAMTRAKTHLILTWRREVMTFYGQGFKVIEPQRSRFLDDLMSSKKKKKNKINKKSNRADLGSMNRKPFRKPRSGTVLTPTSIGEKVGGSQSESRQKLRKPRSGTVLTPTKINEYRTTNSLPRSRRISKSEKGKILPATQMNKLKGTKATSRPKRRSSQISDIERFQAKKESQRISNPPETMQIPEAPGGLSWEDWDPTPNGS